MGTSLGSLPTLSGGVVRRQGQRGGTRSQAPRRQTQQAQPAAPPQQAPTFAQLQQQGVARPAPMQQPPPPPNVSGISPGYQGSGQANQVRGQLQNTVSQALQSPSRYDNEAFTTIRDAAYGDLQNQFARKRQGLEENLASRGLSASTYGANDLYSLQGEEDRAMANLNATLLREAANTQAADRTSAASIAGNLANTAGSQDLATYGANTATTNQNFGNQLAGQSFGENQRQFDLQQELNRALGLGGLDLENRSLAQSGDIARSGLDLQNRSLEQSGQQFGQSLGENSRQFNVAQGEGSRQFDLQQELNRALGLGGLDLQNRSLAQQGEQFGQSQQTTRDLASQSDKTTNRGLDLGAQSSRNNALAQFAMAALQSGASIDPTLLAQISQWFNGGDGRQPLIQPERGLPGGTKPPPTTGTPLYPKKGDNDGDGYDDGDTNRDGVVDRRDLTPDGAPVLRVGSGYGSMDQAPGRFGNPAGGASRFGQRGLPSGLSSQVASALADGGGGGAPPASGNGVNGQVGQSGLYDAGNATDQDRQQVTGTLTMLRQYQSQNPAFVQRFLSGLPPQVAAIYRQALSGGVDDQSATAQLLQAVAAENVRRRGMS